MGIGEFLGGVTPIVRGHCDSCGFVRNIWVSELHLDEVPCDHRKRGCVGVLTKAYVGPKAGVPSHLSGSRRCSCPDETRAPDAASSSSSSSLGQASSGQQDVNEECPVCCEPLKMTDAAMRCRGCAGHRHYFHAACLASWIRQCQKDDNDPNCPICRGPLLVHKRRLGDFLRSAGGSLEQEEGPHCNVCMNMQKPPLEMRRAGLK
ncbi:unnamed protein product, partial [Polarella glacialis]